MSYDQSVKHNLLLKSFFSRAECAAALFCFFRMQPPTAEVHARTKDESKTWRLRLAAGGWVDANRGGIKGAVSLTGTGLFPLCPNPPILHLHRNKKHAAKPPPPTHTTLLLCQWGTIKHTCKMVDCEYTSILNNVVLAYCRGLIPHLTS